MNAGESFILKIWDSSTGDILDYPESFDCWYNNNGAPMDGCGDVDEVYNFPVSTGGDGNTIVPDENYFGDLTVPVFVDDGEAENSQSNTFDLLVTVTSVNDAGPVLGEIGPQGTDEDFRSWWNGLNDIRSRIQNGKRNVQQGLFDSAIQEYEAITEKYPYFPEAQFYMGLTKFRQKDIEGAAFYFSEALKIYPGHKKARKGLIPFIKRIVRPSAFTIEKNVHYKQLDSNSSGNNGFLNS